MSYDIVTIDGDGIGPEVCQSTVAVLREACGSDRLNFIVSDGGALHYQRTGQVLPDDTLAACRSAHAILHGAAGLPGVTYPDGTEVGNDLHLRLRSKLDLFANMRPIRLLRGVQCPLKDWQPGQIDYVIVRERSIRQSRCWRALARRTCHRHAGRYTKRCGACGALRV
jgi:3-isopropylmalate dehydrogenase